ncbi:MAG TPA: hypothetical protein VK864_11145 [Longimicrobiales bacterium]|nr:hypothetical protein [Longimicrobiales bacterium]
MSRTVPAVRTMRATAFFVVALLFSGCDRPSEEPAVPQWRLEPELRVPLGAGADVWDIELRPDTVIYTLHPNESLIRAISHQGKTVRTIGGRGGAPGQFTAPTAFGWHRDTLWVFDAVQKRLTRFLGSGAVIDTRAVLQQPAVVPRRTEMLFETALPNGTVLAQTFPTSDQPGDTVVVRSLLRLSAEGALLDTVAVFRERNRWLRVRNGETPRLSALQPFAPIAHIAYSAVDGMIVLATPGQSDDGEPVYHLTKVNQVGDTLFSKALPFDLERLRRARVSSELARVVREQQNFWQGARPEPRQQERLIRDALFVPRYLPTVTGLVIATDGTILVRRAEPGPEVRWSVYNRKGDHVADQRGPAALKALAAGGPFVYGVEPDENGVTGLVRYRVRSK